MDLGQRRRAERRDIRPDPPTGEFHQFKITLNDSRPSIWRRIQVSDCTLDKLHEHIQTSMGWKNSHLNHFKIDEKYYRDPLLMEETFEQLGDEDSTTILLSDIIPEDDRKFRFRYENDSLDHEPSLTAYQAAESNHARRGSYPRPSTGYLMIKVSAGAR